jgi:hypothetical protein
MGKIVLAVLALSFMASSAQADMYVWFTADGQGGLGTVPVVPVNKGDTVLITGWIQGFASGMWTGNIGGFGHDLDESTVLVTTTFDPLVNIPNPPWSQFQTGAANVGGHLLDDVGAVGNVGPGVAQAMYSFEIYISSDFVPSDYIVFSIVGSGGGAVTVEDYNGYGFYTGFIWPGDATAGFYGDAYFGATDVLVLHVTPEPATLVLLGMGALALIRRR